MFISELTKYLSLSFIVLLGVFYAKLFYVNRRQLKFAWHNNGFFLPILPILGSTYVSIFAKRRNVLAIANWCFKYIGGPLNFWNGHIYCYATNNAEELKIIMNHPKCLNKGKVYIDVERILGVNSLAFALSDTWRGRRRHFLKNFKTGILKTYIETYYKCSIKLVDDLKKLNGDVTSPKLLNTYVFKAFSETSLGISEQECQGEIMEFGKLRLKIEEAITSKLLLPFLPFSWWSYCFPLGRKYKEYYDRIKIIVERIVREKKIKIAQDLDYIENSTELPLLDLILSYNNKISSEEEICQEIILFGSASNETSSLVLFLGLTLLGVYQDIQENVYNEVMTEIGDNDITSQNVGFLKYTEAVISEILRLLPPLPLISRKTGADIDIGTKIVPKGTDILVPLYQLHRNPKYWENPEKFDPTRFLPENINKIVPYSYMPFSAGPRDCIGKHQAMALLKITYANVIRNFRIRSTHTSIQDFDLCSAITLYPNKHLDLRFELRQN
ncbi:cytochrome P450 4C1-like [Anthonomus grandis grandis]|uniref:cytochrome P450 4C1-like n=1 Tax=Anthonomus grandis grandis TaxID=2921223 RepID=UPI0021655887|nr:cytochrome P450 4C1-like [Anthonomus grandis grandis]